MCNGKCGCGGGCTVHKLCKVLLLIGGLNWGLVGVAMLMNNGTNLNVVNLLLGKWPMVEGIVYVLVGLAAIGKIVGCRCSKCMSCSVEGSEGKM